MTRARILGRVAIPLLCCASGAAQAPLPQMPTGTPMPVVAQPKPAQTDTVSTLHGRVAAADTGQTVKLELSLIE